MSRNPGMHTKRAHVLVVGGTGILRPAVESLVRDRSEVTVVARRARNRPPLVHAARVDLRDAALLGGVLDEAAAARGAFDAALVYAPAAPESSMENIAENVRGRIVYLLESEWNAPDRTPEERTARTPPGSAKLVVRINLGWTREGRGREVRWHTPEEISAAALAALEGHEPEVTLGALRPWSERP